MTSLIASPRRALLLIAVLCLAAVGIALVSQYLFDMPPCAWCVMQRLIYLTIAALAILGALLGALFSKLPPERIGRIALAACLLLAVAGAVAAGYQHNVAAQSFSCDMTFADRFMTASGLEALLPAVFGIYASCMDAAVTVLGVEYAVWSLGVFAVIAVIALAGILRKQA